MKKIFLLMTLLVSLTTFAQDGKDICEVYGRKALSCHQAGYLALNYDETGEECGVDGDNFWDISMSNDETFKAIVGGHFYNQFGNSFTSQTMCAITFLENSKKCSFTMSIFLTDEDADVDFSKVNCL